MLDTGCSMLGSAGVVAMSVSVERRIGRFEPEPHNPASSIQHPVSVSAPIGVDTRYDQHRVSSIQYLYQRRSVLIHGMTSIEYPASSIELPTRSRSKPHPHSQTLSQPLNRLKQPI
jgi:hypothetical protein